MDINAGSLFHGLTLILVQFHFFICSCQFSSILPLKSLLTSFRYDLYVSSLNPFWSSSLQSSQDLCLDYKF